MASKGIKGTTVDELVARVHIPKGTFYLFYASKELLPGLEESVLNTCSAAFRALFLTAAYQREIGDLYDDALSVLIRGLVIQMM